MPTLRNELPNKINGAALEIHKFPSHYSVGYWDVKGCLLKYHGGVLLFKASKKKDAIKTMHDYLSKVGEIYAQ